jgi:hypothetical protein
MPDPVAERLAALPALSKAALCGLWEGLFGSPPPQHLRRELMIAVLAYRIQEQAFGSIRPATRTRLRQLGRAFQSDPQAAVHSVPRIKPGTRLVRQWQDQVHLVNVEASGYEYRGARYQSLSEIARLITGTRWSGPLFFGIQAEQFDRNTEVAQ